MSAHPKGGRPAFPNNNQFGPQGDREEWSSPGLSLRYYMASKALQGLLANPGLKNEILKQGGARSGWIERSALAFADAMIDIVEGKP